MQIKVLLGGRQKDTASETSHCCGFSFIPTYYLILEVRPKPTTRTDSNSPGRSATSCPMTLSAGFITDT